MTARAFPSSPLLTMTLGVITVASTLGLVEGDAEAEVAGCGHGGRDSQPLGDRPRQGVGAVMAAQQRHHRRAVLGRREHRRLGPLVAQERCHGTDQDAAGAQPDHRPPGGEQAGHMRRGLGEPLVGRAVGAGGGMDLGTRQQFAQPAGQGGAARAQDDDGGAGHGRLRWRPAMIREK